MSLTCHRGRRNRVGYTQEVSEGPRIFDEERDGTSGDRDPCVTTNPRSDVVEETRSDNTVGVCPTPLLGE